MSLMDFTSKRVLITGSAMGIGYGAAEAFREGGARVAINGRSAEGVNRAIDTLGGGPALAAAPGDLSSVAVYQDVVRRAVEAFGGLDCLVNNTGICPLATPRR